MPGPVRGGRPAGRHHDEQEPGRYRLEHEGDDELFGWAVGPDRGRPSYFPPTQELWRAPGDDGGSTLMEPDDRSAAGHRRRPAVRVAALGRARPGAARRRRARPPLLRRRREGAFVVVVECGSPAATCFCTSMGTGPAAEGRFDLALTELTMTTVTGSWSACGPTGGRGPGAWAHHRAARGVTSPPRDPCSAARVRPSTGSSPPTGWPALLARNLEHPRWDEVAERCLACGNCTLVCPTCFCSDVRTPPRCRATVGGARTWASCFDLDHSYLHGGPVRPIASSRYRQWMTHKLSTWWDQFGTSGCVGCGRCIAWCPVGHRHHRGGGGDRGAPTGRAAGRRRRAGPGEPPRRSPTLVPRTRFFVGLPGDAVARWPVAPRTWRSARATSCWPRGTRRTRSTWCAGAGWPSRSTLRGGGRW